MNSRVLQNRAYLRDLHNSHEHALKMADSGSDCEDMYYVEKLRYMARVMGYELVRIEYKGENHE